MPSPTITIQFDPTPRPKCVSLFSGAGISDWGFHAADWESVAQVEIDKHASNVRKKHFPDAQHFKDIYDFDTADFRGVDGIFAGFPCQDYSVAGNRAGLAGDRGALFWQLDRVIGEIMPPVIGLENVPGLLSADDGRALATILVSLVQRGYRLTWRVLNLRYFGVPQRRRRVLIGGYLGGKCRREVQLEPESMCRHLASLQEEGEETAGDVAGCLGGGSGARGWPNKLDDAGAFIPVQSSTLNAAMAKGKNGQDTGLLTAHTLRADGFDASEDGTGRGTPLVAFSGRDRGDDGRGYGRAPQVFEPGTVGSLDTMKPHCVAFSCKDAGVDAGHLSPTMRSMGHDDSHANGGGQVAVQQGWRVRRLTPRECERLTGLPDDFSRWGADGKEIADGPRYKMLGNAWAVPQAEWLARILAEALT